MEEAHVVGEEPVSADDHVDRCGANRCSRSLDQRLVSEPSTLRGRAAKAANIVCLDIPATQTANDGVCFQRGVLPAGVEVVADDALP